MEVTKVIPKSNSLKQLSKVALVVLLLYTIVQLASTYQTERQLDTPLIPKSTIWEINKQLVFTALVAAIGAVVAIILYFFEKYLLVVILVGLILLATRYIYI